MDLKKLIVDAIKPLLKEFLIGYLFPELEKIVKTSENKIDDALLASFEEPLKQAITSLLDKA